MRFCQLAVCLVLVTNLWPQQMPESEAATATTRQQGQTEEQHPDDSSQKLASISSSSGNRRPRIGLVLEGGGALGLAHVGVLKWLEENRIPVDVIAGSSMG